MHGASGYEMAGGRTCDEHQQPDEQELCCYCPAAGLEGKTADNTAQADIICLGQRMQPGIDVWKAYQAHGAGQKKRQAEYDEHRAAIVEDIHVFFCRNLARYGG